MDPRRFDALTRSLSAPGSRRRLVAGLAGAALGALGLRGAGAVACRAPGELCREDANCCSHRCAKDAFGRRCACPEGTEVCGRACVDPATGFLADPRNCGSCGHRCPRTRCEVAACNQGVCGLAPDPAAVGVACDDADPCTAGTTCQADGSCGGGGPAPDKTACLGGLCCGGVCRAGAACCADADCTAPATCGGGGTPNQCGCTPESQATTCAGKCGSQTNNCGQSVDCGACCTAPSQPCSSAVECCQDHPTICSTGNSSQTICCRVLGGACSSAFDCCGATSSCNGSTCGGNGASCQSGGDCFSGHCCNINQFGVGFCQSSCTG